MKALHEVRKYENKFRVWVGTYKNIGFIPHWHKEIELIYVKNGCAKMRINGKSFLAEKGDLVICDSGSTHASPTFNMNNTLEFLIFDTSVLSGSYSASDFENPHITSFQLEELGLKDELKRMLKILKSELSEKPSYYRETSESAIRFFWFLLKRSLPSENKNDSKSSRLVQKMEKLLIYLNENFTESIPLEVAAEKLKMSVCHFSRMFKKMNGISYVSYINNLRVEYAAELLKDNSSTVIDIALNCGFNNVRTFNRVFKTITGYTPVQFSKLSVSEMMGTSYFPASYEEFYVENNDSSVIIRKNY